MADFKTSGCDKCRMGFLSSEMPPPTKLAHYRGGPLILYRCDVCGTYWEEDPHHPVAITEAEARKKFPHAFNA